LSNFAAKEVEQIVKICKENNYVLPSVYQGNYNAITRLNEDDLFPLLRREKISFYAYSPAAGGFFVQRPDVKAAPGSRWDPQTVTGNMYGGLYAKPSYYNVNAPMKLLLMSFRHLNVLQLLMTNTCWTILKLL
jgi:aflatoxin B1 aldehyde reductase